MKVLFYIVILIMISSSMACSSKIFSKISSMFSFLTTEPEGMRHHWSQIVGGELTDIEAHPYQVSIQTGVGHICGGSLVTLEWILTAAHCFIPEEIGTRMFKIRAGSSDIRTGGMVRRESKIVVHPKYSSMSDDIALIKVDEPFVETAGLKTIQLIEANKEVPPGTHVTVSGWGYTEEDGRGSMLLKQVGLVTISDDECLPKINETIQKDFVANVMLCTMSDDGAKDACSGDSGGPLIIQGPVLVGVVSWGEGCARPGKPGIFTEVSKFRGWIAETIKH